MRWTERDKALYLGHYWASWMGGFGIERAHLLWARVFGARWQGPMHPPSVCALAEVYTRRLDNGPR